MARFLHLSPSPPFPFCFVCQVPFVCICNDRQHTKIRSLAGHCFDLKLRRPTKAQIAKRACDIAAREGLGLEPNAAELLAESCGNDIRQVLNCLQMWQKKMPDSGPQVSTREEHPRGAPERKRVQLRARAPLSDLGWRPARGCPCKRSTRG